jgi:hypothetical protein
VNAKTQKPVLWQRSQSVNDGRDGSANALDVDRLVFAGTNLPIVLYDY